MTPPLARLAVFASALVLAACAPEAQLIHVEAPGTIVTLVPEQPAVEGLVVREGKVVAEGTLADLRGAYPQAVDRNLGPVTLVPGFVDAHVHVRQLGLDALRVDVRACLEVACMVEALRAAEPDPSPGVWIIGQGWDEGVWASQGYPDRAELDAAFPDNPVLLHSLHGFASFANGVALEAGGIDADTPDPEGGTIVRDDQGQATGVLLTLAQALVRDQVPAPSLDQRRSAILAGLWRLAAAGVTTIHEAGMSSADVEAFMSLAEDGSLPTRVYGLLDGNDEALVEHWLERGMLVDPQDRLTIRGFKVFYDGSLGSRTALLAEPYADAPDQAHPTERIRPERLETLAFAAREASFQLAVHAIGDEANRRILDLVGETFAGALGDHRWRLEHAQVMVEADFARAAELGVIASMQPSHAVGDSAWAEERLGPERAALAYAWRRFLDAGAVLTLNSDLPGEPWRPLETLQFAVTRQPLDGSAPAWFPDQALSVDEALHAMSVAGAYAGFAEGRLGQLQAGAWADFVVLEADPRAVEPGAIAAIELRETWVAGQPLKFPR